MDNEQPVKKTIPQHFAEWEVRRARFQKEKPHYYYPLVLVLCFLAFTIQHFYENWLDSIWPNVMAMRWGWIVKMIVPVIFGMIVVVLFVLEFRSAKKKAIHLSWTGWIIAMFLATELGWLHLKAYESSIQQSAILNKPKFEVYLNSIYVTNNIVIPEVSLNRIFFQVYNVGTETATNLTVLFFAPCWATNFSDYNGWLLFNPEPKLINHKLYDRTGSCTLIAQAPTPLSTTYPQSGFNFTAFTIAPKCPLIDNPIEGMQKYGFMLDFTKGELDGFFCQCT